ncbi:hypothetical protein BGW36DRAFT_403284 [Talaromyces proteolyticus]|uniref:Rhodopsin domain-containing protein n=1 Tax=Talaromyces proteolyticus TaxID=1131652 RepID=A0AAD4L379_9EURO|nr:uncharacterized protein BGW36DRAFT_403284 [Talaromyces proteolyticus]KAH8705771.1 hypothetical protein BGW36DRAFT_403284 [Talaromyces proteolyticus]
MRMVQSGIGLRTDVFPQENLSYIFILDFAFDYVYISALTAIKLSLLILYHRIFVDKPTRIGARILGGIILAWLISNIFLTTFQCIPIARIWSNGPGGCIDTTSFILAAAIPNIITDAAILCLPMTSVWKLHAAVAYRASITFMFLLGGFVTCTSIYRAVLLSTNSTDDVDTYAASKAYTWSIVEVSAGIISACLPTLRPIVRKLTHRFDSTITPSSRTGYQNSAWGPTTNISTPKPRREVGDSSTEPEFNFSDQYPLNSIRAETTWELSVQPAPGNHSSRESFA